MTIKRVTTSLYFTYLCLESKKYGVKKGHYVEVEVRGKPIPCRVVGKATKNILPSMPIPTGSAASTSFVPGDGSGHKHSTTLSLNMATAANTTKDITACAKSINLSLYLAAISGGRVADPSMIHMPLNVAKP